MDCFVAFAPRNDEVYSDNFRLRRDLIIAQDILNIRLRR